MLKHENDLQIALRAKMNMLYHYEITLMYTSFTLTLVKLLKGIKSMFSP